MISPFSYFVAKLINEFHAATAVEEVGVRYVEPVLISAFREPLLTPAPTIAKLLIYQPGSGLYVQSSKHDVFEVPDHGASQYSLHTFDVRLSRIRSPEVKDVNRDR